MCRLSRRQTRRPMVKTKTSRQGEAAARVADSGEAQVFEAQAAPDKVLKDRTK